MNIIFGLLLQIVFIIASMIIKINSKKIDINPITLNLFSGVSTFIIFIIYIYIDYNFNPKKYKINRNNSLNFNNNPFRNIYNNKYSWIIGGCGTVMFLLFLFALQNIPLSLAIPINVTWLFFALIFGKIILNSPITKDKIISIIIVIIGVILTSWHHFTNINIGKDKNLWSLIFFVGLLIISNILRAYQVTLVKKIENQVSSQQLLLMDWGIISVISIILYLIYIGNPIKKWTVKNPTIDNIYKFYLLIFFIAIISTFSRMKAIKMLPENLFNLLSCSSIILSILAGKLFFQEQITLTQIIGCFIIVLGILYHNILKFIHNKLKYHSLHQYATV